MKNTKKTKRGLSKKYQLILWLIAIVVIISMDMYQGFKVDLLMKDLHQLEQQKKRLLNETEQLRSEVNQKRNIDTISRAARKKFGLISNTDQIKIVKIEDFDQLKKAKKDLRINDEKSRGYNLAGVR